MAKDKLLPKAERKAAKAARKAEKQAKMEAKGVSKTKTKNKAKYDKKGNKEKKAEKEAIAEQALKEIEDAEEVVEVKGDKKKVLVDVDMSNGVGKDGEVVSDEEEQSSSKVVRPIGALVPFANPLADEKVGKKVFKSVKKGMSRFKIRIS